MVYESYERVFNLSKCCIIGPQVDSNFSGCRRNENLIFSNFKKNTRSLNHKEELEGEVTSSPGSAFYCVTHGHLNELNKM